MLRIFMKSDKKSVRRIKRLSGVLDEENHHITCKRCNHDAYISIGSAKVPLAIPKVPEYVPYSYVPENKELPQSAVRHLRWIAQKDLLGQDIFLIGPPGPLRRNLAMQYLELTRREVEYIPLSRDTTESDLKQRREMRSGTSFYINQCAVRAAIEGRVLVLEGIEKAERNVLPALNNLLENREMQLDDGRFLMHPKRYDQLLKEYSKEELDEWQLVRVSEKFRVFALGLPVPKFRGHPLDPPLRSRFQARDVYHISFSDKLQELYACAPSVDSNVLAQVLSCSSTLITEDSANLGLPDFPLDNLTSLVSVLEQIPHYPLPDLLSRLYPYRLLLSKEGAQAVEDIYKKFEMTKSDGDMAASLRCDWSKTCWSDNRAEVELTMANNCYRLQILCGDHQTSTHQRFISTPFHQQLIADLLLSHYVTDICLIGGKGCGKSSVIRQLASLLRYRTEPVMLYQDMTSRDLLQQRYTLPNGDTMWKLSPLVLAALDGGLAVLDGLHRVNPGTLSVLQRLVHDREITLHDGTRLLRHDKYDAFKSKLNVSDEEMHEKLVYRIHPAFRMIALAEPPKPGSSTQQWLNPELLTLFFYHHMAPLSASNESGVINAMVPDLDTSAVSSLLAVSQRLRAGNDADSISLAASLSTRQLIRIACRLVAAKNSNHDTKSLISDAVHKACLSRFLPHLARSTLCEALKKCGLPSEPLPVKDLTLNDISCEVKDGVLRIGDVACPVYGGNSAADSPSQAAKVPDVLFYDNAQHLAVMKDMLQDYILGEHLLLVGNQGVGKNKIIDRLLHLLNKPREYIQLHRDTTVQSLTVQPTVRDGIIVYEDSALVRAIRHGRGLVVDEADKAPTHVTCVLKALLESGRATLADGRKVVTDPAELENLSRSTSTSEVILMHPDFRMFILANRPGFPFLGNDFFGALGDVFSCHAVDNPSVGSELEMLRKYGSDVPAATLKKLVASFGELRDLADRGLIAYPYSTREVVNIVKHLQEFPEEGLASVVRNVFDFDAYNVETGQQISSVMHKHGIPVGAKPHDVRLAKPFPLPAPKLTGYWTYKQTGGAVVNCDVDCQRAQIKGPAFLNVQSYAIERIEDRGLDFSEQVAHWNLPQFYHTTIVTDIATAAGADADGRESVYVAVVNSSAIYRYDRGDDDVVRYIDLYDVVPELTAMTQACIKLAPLGRPLEGSVVVFEEKTKTTLTVDTNTGAVRRIHVPAIAPSSDGGSVFNRFRSNEPSGIWRMCSDFASDFCSVVFYQHEGTKVVHLNLLDGLVHHMETPFKISNLQQVSSHRWLISEQLPSSSHPRKYLVEPDAEDSVIPSKIITISSDGLDMGFGSIKDDPIQQTRAHSKSDLSADQLSAALGQSMDAPNRVMMDDVSFARFVVGFPQLKSASEVYTIPRDTILTVPDEDDGGRLLYRGMTKRVAPAPACRVLAGDVNQTIRIVPEAYVSGHHQSSEQRGKDRMNSQYYMEVADLGHRVVRYVPLPRAVSTSPYVSWQSGISESGFQMTSANSSLTLFTVDTGGCVREWETGLVNLRRSLQEWRAMIGSEDERDHLQITTEGESGKDVTAPKHGKIDPSNAPHVGGNTWAGGTGGRDTAGMGGKGGPYRLDLGHDVTQIPDWEKEAVPQHVKDAAREMGQKAFKERLHEIRMSEYDAEMYEKFSSGVRKQVKALRIILDALQAKSKERQWLKHQTTGELDDMKLIEGLTGERNIYKRRADEEPEPGTPQLKPKRLRVVVDVSGSMYRFNGLDNRLERSMEAACMVMEAFDGYKDKFMYELWGHSGDGYDINFVNYAKPPANNRERLEVLKTMHAHAQFCMSGDHTLEATRHAIKSIKDEEADEYFVVVLSDANLQRYGIRPSSFTDALTCDDQVHAFVVFIGSLGDQAERLKAHLPPGRSFVCLDTKNIPQIMQQIFTSSMFH